MNVQKKLVEGQNNIIFIFSAIKKEVIYDLISLARQFFYFIHVFGFDGILSDKNKGIATNQIYSPKIKITF